MEGLFATRIKATCAAARTSGGLYADDREARDRAIGEANAAGHGEREIRRWTVDEDGKMMSLSQVQRICVFQEIERQAQTARALS